jgi:hypothetical protein
MKEVILKVLMTPFVFLFALVGLILLCLIGIAISPILAVFGVITFWEGDEEEPEENKPLTQEDLDLIEEIEGEAKELLEEIVDVYSGSSTKSDLVN